MLYPIRRYLQTQIAMSVDDFFNETKWLQSDVDQWEERHTVLRDLPVALLEDLAAASKKSQSLAETWAQLNLFQKEYFAYVAQFKNRYNRILNQNVFMADLAIFTDSLVETEVLARTVLGRLDELVYQDSFEVNENFHNQLINERIKIEEDDHLYEMVMAFLVKIVYTDGGWPVVFYEYLGKNQKLQATYQTKTLES